VLPGDGSAEWKDALPDELVPWRTNPPSGALSTANNDPLGDTVDNDPSDDVLPDGTPMYTGCFFDVGFRQGRIQSRLAEKSVLSPEDMADVQGDVRSPMGDALAPRIVEAIDRAEEERAKPGSHPALSTVVADPAYDPALVQAARDLLAKWGALADYEARSGIDPETNEPLQGKADDPEIVGSQATLLFNAWLVRIIPRTFGDELAKMGGLKMSTRNSALALLHLFDAWAPTLATYDAASLDSAIWDDLDTPALETRHERIVRALLDALAWLKEDVGAEPASWRWGARHTIRFNALVPIYSKLSIPPAGEETFTKGFPRHGDMFVVDASNYPLWVALDKAPNHSYSSGPTQRFVVDMDPSGPRAQNALPGGNVWDAASPHFSDEAAYWRKNQTHPIPFSLDDVVAKKESRIVAHP
jgi:penicillin amidase